MRAIALPHTPFDWMQFLARLLCVLWAGFWTFFCVASGIGEHEGLAGALIHQVPALVFIATVALAWKHERAGGFVLIATAMAAFFFFHMYRQAAVVGLTIAGPPCLCGMLFLLHARRSGG
jgi:hypothetical protein